MCNPFSGIDGINKEEDGYFYNIMHATWLMVDEISPKELFKPLLHT